MDSQHGETQGNEIIGVSYDGDYGIAILKQHNTTFYALSVWNGKHYQIASDWTTNKTKIEKQVQDMKEYNFASTRITRHDSGMLN